MEEKEFPSEYRSNHIYGSDKKKYNKSFETDLFKYFNTMKELCPDFCFKLKQNLDKINNDDMYKNKSYSSTKDNKINKVYFTYNTTNESLQSTLKSTGSRAQITLKKFYSQTTPTEENYVENDYIEYDNKIQENSGENDKDSEGTEDYNFINTEAVHKFTKQTPWHSFWHKMSKTIEPLSKNKVLRTPKHKSSKIIHQNERSFGNGKQVVATRDPLIKPKKKRTKLGELQHKNKYPKHKQLYNLIKAYKSNKNNNALNLNNMKIKTEHRYKHRAFYTKSPLKKNIGHRNGNHKRNCNYRFNNYIMVD